ncbi:metallophosphoesterase [Myxococcus sp. K15C18031901]|uniref:metallophosphoesterase family protein n=1 Tax=Myxococcus dinghuensis TaxID=2906761 RepID=UPI0020A728EE|nr:metallophosphoesterase [Myxococcus dinghuensis]MCP3099945.1 metallophosphoesterase [Myxococcus dinghuensis]
MLLGAGCGVFEFHPYEIRGGEEALNAKALARLPRDEPERPFRFAVMGDIQLFLDDSADAVKDLAHRDIDLVVQLGDLTEYGTAQEYEWVARMLARIPVPTFAVIGNHDLMGKGGLLYLRTFGPTFQSFDYQGSRFVLFDSNSLEYGFSGRVPDLVRLREALVPEPGLRHIFTFSHVPPGHSDFDPDLTEPLEELQAEAGVSLSFHAHTHRYSSEVRRGVRYFVADALESRNYLLVTVSGGSVDVERVYY